MSKLTNLVACVAFAAIGGSLFAYNGGYENSLDYTKNSGGYGNYALTAREESGTTIAANKYAQCKKLTSVSLAKVTSIGNAAFAYSALTSVELPSTLTSMGYIAFGGCTNLSSVTVNNWNWYSADKEPFKDCTALTDLTVPGGVPKNVDVKSLFPKVKILRCPASNMTAWKSVYSSAQIVSSEKYYTIRFNKNDGSESKKDELFFTGKSKQLPWPGSGLGWTRSGYTFSGWAIAPKSAVPTYVNGETVKDIAAVGKTINLYAIWKPSSKYTYTVQFHAMDGTGRTYNQQYAKDEAKCLAWLDSVLKWSRPGYIFCGWSTVGSSRVCNYNNGSKVSNLTTTPNETVHLYAVWLSGSSHRVIFHRNLNATDDLTRQEVFWKGTEATLAYLESQLGWNYKGHSFVGWAYTANATKANFTNGQRVKDLAGSGKTLHLYAVWSNNSPGAASRASVRSAPGVAIPAYAIRTEQRPSFEAGYYHGLLAAEDGMFDLLLSDSNDSDFDAFLRIEGPDQSVEIEAAAWISGDSLVIGSEEMGRIVIDADGDAYLLQKE